MTSAQFIEQREGYCTNILYDAFLFTFYVLKTTKNINGYINLERMVGNRNYMDYYICRKSRYHEEE